MIVFYDETDGNAVKAVYSSPPASTRWDAFARAEVSGRLVNTVHLVHHKVRKTTRRETFENVTTDTDNPAALPEDVDVFDLVEMTAAEKAAHPIPTPTP